MKKYLCLICAETVMEGMTETDAAKLFHEYAECTESIKRGGQFIGANRLKPRDTTSTTIRVRNGKLLVTDGPFAETREQLGTKGIPVVEN